MSKSFPIFAAVVSCLLLPASASAQVREHETVNNARIVLDEVMRVREQRIPASLLEKAEGVVIVPNMIKGGFVVGLRHGHGVAMIKNPQGGWDAPRFVQMTGGSVGFQAGVQSTDVVLVFMTKKSVNGLLTGKFTIGADAAAAAGPVGRQLAAATDARFKAEILSYSRSRGLFAGVSLDGSGLHLDPRSEFAYYGMPKEGKYQTVPESAIRLVQQLTAYTDPTAGAPVAVEKKPSDVVPPKPAQKPVREQLADASIKLSQRLPADWQRYLALTAGVYDPKQSDKAADVKPVLARYETIAGDKRYQQLTNTPEFQDVLKLLRQYEQSLRGSADGKLSLPPPPGR